MTGIARRSRVAVVAAALVVIMEGGNLVDAFVVPSSPLANTLVPGMLSQPEDSLTSTALRSIQFIKGKTKYGDIVDGSVNSGMLNSLGGTGSSSMRGFGGNSGRRGVGTNSFARTRRPRNAPSWWTSRSNFSRSTPTSLLAAGSLESWPVMEADDIQILVKKGIDLEDDEDDDMQQEVYDEYGNRIVSQTKQKKKSVKATLERWERDLALPVVGYDNGGYPMLGNEMQPNSNNANDRCTQSIQFDVTNGDIYPFSGTISVPPPLTVEDSMGNQQTVMMVLNNPDDDEDDQSYDEFGNQMMLPGSSSFDSMQKKKKGKVIEAMLEPLYKTPDEKYVEAQQNQQQQYPEYDEYGNEIYNNSMQSFDQQKTTIPSQGYQAFPLDAMDPSSGKIKISFEREGGGGGIGGAFQNALGGGNNNEISQARVEIYHGFRDQFGNPHSYNAEEEDRRIALDVSTMHPSFSSVIDTMPADLLAKYSALDQNQGYQPYLEVRIVNTGGAALKAGVQSYLPYYKPQNQQEKKRRQYQRERFERKQTLNQSGRQFSSTGMSMGSNTVKADDPFLLVDSAQSSTSARRIKKNTASTSSRQKSYVRFDNASKNINSNYNGQSFSQSSNFMNQDYGGNYGGGNNVGNYDQWSAETNFPRRSAKTDGVKPNVPGGSSSFGATSESRANTSSSSRQRQRLYQGSMMNGDRTMLYPSRNRVSTDMGRTAMFVDGMGRSFNDAPEIPRSPDYYNQQQRFDRAGGRGTTIDTIATTSSGRSSGLVTPDNDFSNPNSVKKSENKNKRGMGMVRRPVMGSSSLSSFGGNSGLVSGMKQGFRPQVLQDGSDGQFSAGRGQFQGAPGSSQGRFQQGMPQRRGPSTTFSGNGNVIGDGVISGRPPSAGVSPFDSGMPNNSNRFNGRSMSTNNGYYSSGNENGFLGQNNNGMAMNNNNSFYGNNNNADSGPFGNMGRPPQTKGNSKNPFATLNGESSKDDFTNNYGAGGTSFGGINNRMNNMNAGNAPFGAPGAIGGSSQRPNNPFSNLNGNKNKNPFGNIGTPGGSSTAMRSSFDDYTSYEEEEERNPIVGFAKNIVRGIRGER